MRVRRVGSGPGVTATGMILRAMTLALALLILSGQCAFSWQAAGPECGALPADAPAEYEVKGDSVACYAVALRPGELLRVRVWQKDSEIQLKLLDAAGVEEARMSSPREKDGLETLSFVAAVAGSYRLEVGLLNKQAGAGRFTILREPAREANATDRRRVEVERLFAEGMAARDTAGQAETAIKKFSEASAGWRELGDEYMLWLSELLVTRSRARARFIEARDLLNKERPEPGGTNYRTASEKFQEARRLFHEGGESINEGASLLGAALAELGLGNVAGTINFVEQSLPIFEADKGVKVDLLTNLVTYYLILRDTDSAIDRLREARSIYAALGQADKEGTVANDLGGLYLEIGKYDDARKYLEESLELRKKSGDRCGVPATLSNLGLYYYAVGQKARAQELLLDDSLRQYPPGYECAFGKADTLLSVGKFYYELGANDLALKYLGEADGFVEAILQGVEAAEAQIRQKPMDTGEFAVAKSMIISLRAKYKSDKALMLNLVGAANFAQAKYQEEQIPLTVSSPRRAAEAKARVRGLYDTALGSYKEALSLYREIPDRKHEATVLTNTGVVLSALGRADEVMAAFDDALKAGRGAEDKDAEAITLNNVGEFYAAQGEHRRALEFYGRALPLLKAVQDKEGQAITLADSMYAWGLVGNRRMAIFCGKQAINIFQELRGSARGLATEIQKDYLRRVRNSYQHLAELLIEEGRHAQAVQVLNLYQDQQFFDPGRDNCAGHDFDDCVGQAAFTEREREWARRYDAAGESLALLNTRADELRRHIGYRPLTAEQSHQLDELKAELEKGSGAFAGIIEGAEKEFALPPEEKDGAADVTSVTKMQEALDYVEKETRKNGLKQKAFALYTLIGTEKFYVLLVKPDRIEEFSHPIGSVDLNRRVLTALSDIQNPGFPEKILKSGSGLYEIVMGATSADGKITLEAELERERPDVLLWSLDGVLSYFPVAALYDARHSRYLVQKYQNVVLTRADAARITRPPVEWTTAIGFGKSTASEARCEVPCDRPGCDKLEALRFVSKDMKAIFDGTPGRPALLEGHFALNGDFKREALLNVKNIPLVYIASHFCFRPGDAEGSFLLLGDDEKFSLRQMNDYPHLYAGVDLLVLSACQTAALEPNQSGKEIDSLAELSQRLGAASVLATLWNADELGASRLMIKFYSLHRKHKEWSKAELLRRAQLELLEGRETARDTYLAHPYYWAPFVLYGSFR